MAASQDAEGQTHVTAAGRQEVEEERLLEAHASIEQDDEVPYGGGGREHRRVTLGHGTERDEDRLLKLWMKNG